MADYTDLPNSAVGIGGIPSGTTVTALRDNPIAIAEGAPGAPKVVNAALFPAGVFLRQFTASSLSTSGAGGFTTATVGSSVDMDDVASVKLDGGIYIGTGSTTRTLNIQMSSDGGSTWQAATGIVTLTTVTGAEGASFSAYVDMDTGQVYTTSTSGVSTTGSTVTAAGTPPFNAFRFSASGSLLDFSVIGYCISRRPEV